MFSDAIKRSNIQDYEKKRLATQFPQFFTIDREVRQRAPKRLPSTHNKLGKFITHDQTELAKVDQGEMINAIRDTLLADRHRASTEDLASVKKKKKLGQKD